MVGIMISILPDMVGGVASEVEEEDVCPLATQDESINDDLREKAVELTLEKAVVVRLKLKTNVVKR